MPKSKISDSTNRVRELFECALEIPSGQTQDAYLDAECGTDSVLRSEVQSLLRLHSQSNDFLSNTVAGDAISSLEGVLGSTIDRYRILELLGTGGFGEVYRAEQIEPIHREVALKIIKPGMGSREIIARFEAERQALALMDHPNIARVFDAGTTASGRPYFVMELARGLPITRFCDENRLSITERIRLFQKVCRGVQHAHQKGIIHRDLKPSNIVVTRDDAEAEPIPKIIDFGIAKSLQGKLTDATLVSRQATLMGTPAYMSPEQINLGSENLDTRSDIYSLGVILYELLAGTRPIETDEANGANFSEAQRLVCEVEPPRPSVRVKTLGESQETVARLRVTEPLTLSRTLRHDLDWIVMKAIEKDRARRYQGAGELADDIGRYLLLQPVLAGPPTQSYRLGKFVRRHRAGVLATSVAVIALIGGLTASLVGFRQAVAQQRITDQARTRAQEMVDYIMDDLQPQLRMIGRHGSMVGSTGAAVRYFEQLPPELRDRETRKAHARALHLYAKSLGYPEPWFVNDDTTLEDALEKARILWPAVAAENPEDGEAAARAHELLAFWDKHLPHKEDLESLEALDRRFPDDRTVQLYLAVREQYFADSAGLRFPVDEGIAAGLKGLERAERFLAKAPQDPAWLSEKVYLLASLGSAYGNKQQPDTALRYFEQAQSMVETLLKGDPTNFEYVLCDAHVNWVHMWLLFNSGQWSESQFQAALDSLETLSIFDPGNEAWFQCEVAVYHAKAVTDGNKSQFDSAVAVCDQALAQFGQTSPKSEGLKNALRNLIQTAGITEARMGDFEAARLRLNQLREDPWIEQMAAGYEKSERKWRILLEQAFLVSFMADWVELERLGRAMLALESEITSIAGFDDTDDKKRSHKARLDISHTYIGEALYQQDRYAEAIPFLDPAIAGFKETGMVPPYWNFGTWVSAPVAVHLAKAYQETGNPSQALATLEWAFTAGDGLTSSGWMSKPYLWTADTAWQLALLLDPDDPDQATRRDEVLKLGRERLNHVFAHPTLSVSKMLEIQNQYNPVRSAEGAWNLTQLLDPTVPEDAEHQTVLFTLAADWLDRAASGGSLKPEHQELRTRIEAQLAPPIL